MTSLTSHVAGAWPIGRETELSCTALWIPWAVHLSQQAGEDFLEQAWAGNLLHLARQHTTSESVARTLYITRSVHGSDGDPENATLALCGATPVVNSTPRPVTAAW